MKGESDLKPLMELRLYNLSRQDRIFLFNFAVVGLPAGESYRLVYNTKASLHSACAMSSRLLREERFICALGMLKVYGYPLTDKAKRLLREMA